VFRFWAVRTVAAKPLHHETKAVLNQLEQDEWLSITRHGRTLGRIEPLAAPAQPRCLVERGRSRAKSWGKADAGANLIGA